MVGGASDLGHFVGPTHVGLGAMVALGWCTMSASSPLGDLARAVKASISLPKLIGQTLPLSRSGHNWTACCPFRAETTASFTVYADHYHCFGCRAHGNAIDWTMRTRRLTFREAVEYLSSGGQSFSIAEKLVRRSVVPPSGDRESFSRILLRASAQVTASSNA